MERQRVYKHIVASLARLKYVKHIFRFFTEMRNKEAAVSGDNMKLLAAW